MMEKERVSFLKPENVFLVLGILYGIFFLLIDPPFLVPDEPNHFYRAYQISEGRFSAVKELPAIYGPEQIAERDNAGREIRAHFFKGEIEEALQEFYDLKGIGGIGGFLPRSLTTTVNSFLPLLHPGNKQNMRELWPLFKMPLNPDDRIFVHFPNTAVYSPVPYLPQAIGIAAGKAFSSSPLLLMYLGRLFNLLAWAALVYFAVLITPVCKWLFVLLALMPCSLYEAASLSADSLTIGLSFLLIALFIRTAFSQSEADVNLFLLFLASLALALSKQAYFLLPLIFLLIPIRKIGSKIKYYTLFFLLNFLNIAAIMLWTAKADIYRDVYTVYGFLVPDFSAQKQVLFILSQPLQYISILGRTLIQNCRIFIDSFFGYQSEFLKIVHILMLFFVFLSEISEGVAISAMQRIVIFAALSLGTLSVITLAYVGWTPVGDKIVSGIQGRYFIPLSPLVFLLFHRSKPILSVRSNGVALSIISFSFIGMSHTLYANFKQFYG